MFDNKRILAFIPARGGSQGVKNKNIKMLGDKPLIAWTIEEALISKYIDTVFVSTDSEEIAKISKKYKAYVPFLRPAELASNDAKVIDSINYSINTLSDMNDKYQMIIMLQPTSPLRVVFDIDAAIEDLFVSKMESIVSVCEVDHNPLWTNILPKDRNMKDFLDNKYINKNRQELPEYFRLNGAIYFSYLDYLINNNSFFGAFTKAYIMPRERSIDIDTELDFKFAAFLQQFK